MRQVLPTLDHWADIDLKDYPSLDDFNEEGCKLFLAKHPEFHQTDFNSDILLAFLNKRSAPYSLKNLSIAYAHLQAEGKLQLKPASTAPRTAPKKIRTVPVEGGNAVQQPTEAEQKFLRSVRDNPNLTDAQRKDQDARLRRAALAGRRTFTTGEPQIVI